MSAASRVASARTSDPHPAETNEPAETAETTGAAAGTPTDVVPAPTDDFPAPSAGAGWRTHLLSFGSRLRRRASSPPPSAAPYRTRPAGRVVALVLAAVVVLAAALGCAAWSILQSDQQRHADQADAMAVATGAVKPLLSYGPATVDALPGPAGAAMTDRFGVDYTARVARDIAPTVKQQHLTVTTALNGSAVEAAESTPDHIVVLLFLTQSTATASDPTPQPQPTTVIMGLDRAGPRWLISDLTQV